MKFCKGFGVWGLGFGNFIRTSIKNIEESLL